MNTVTVVLIIVLACTIAALVQARRRLHPGPKRERRREWAIRSATARIPNKPKRWSGRTSLTWPEIAAATHETPLHSGPHLVPHLYTDVSPAPLTATPYPVPYVGLVSRLPRVADRSHVLMFMGEEAWLLDVDAPVTPTGTASVTLPPEGTKQAPALHLDTGTFPIYGQPLHLDARGLEELRQHASRWVTHPRQWKFRRPENSPERDQPGNRPTTTHNSGDSTWSTGL